MRTATPFREESGAAPDEPICTDERLREKEFGILDALAIQGLANSKLTKPSSAACSADYTTTRLTARAGARSAAPPLAMMMPEIAVIALPADAEGEIAVAALDPLVASVGRRDVPIPGPAMANGDAMPGLVTRLIAALAPEQGILLDAAAISCVGWLAETLRAHPGLVIITPHHGEMAALLDNRSTRSSPTPPAS